MSEGTAGNVTLGTSLAAGGGSVVVADVNGVKRINAASNIDEVLKSEVGALNRVGQ